MRLPRFFTELQPVGALLAAEGTEEQRISAAVEEEQARTVVSTADGEGLSLWERDLGLPDGTGEPLSLRRGRVLTRLCGGRTLTRRALRDLCRTLAGAEPVCVQEEFEQNAVGVWLPLEPDRDLSVLQEASEQLRPAHLQMTVGMTERSACLLQIAPTGSVVFRIWSEN